MRKRWIVLTVMAALLVFGPFAIPVQSTGTQSNDELAAGGQLIQTGDYRTYVETIAAKNPGGDEPYLLLLHGFGASSFSWREVAEPLSQLGNVIAYDRPAFGFTDRPETWDGVNPYSSQGALEQLAAVIATLVPEGAPVYLVGHSAGGTIAAQYALDNPAQVSGLVLVAPALLTTGGSPGWLNWAFSVPQIDHLGPLLVGQIASTGNAVIEQSFVDKSKVTPAVLAGYRAPLTIRGWEKAFWQFNKAPREFDVTERLDEISVRTLIITGDADTIIATADSIRLDLLVPTSRVEIVTDTGHLPHEEQPEEFMNQLLLQWPWLVAG